MFWCINIYIFHFPPLIKLYHKSNTFNLSSILTERKLFIITLCEPNATKLEKEGLGYVVASIGELSGEMPYTAFYARKSYIEKNEETIKKFNNAINKGLKYVREHTDEEVAKVILKQFPDNSLNDVEIIVKRYRDADSWLENTTISEERYKNLENIMIDNDLLDEYVPFNKLVMNINE